MDRHSSAVRHMRELRRDDRRSGPVDLRPLAISLDDAVGDEVE
jgi:hypothetical protein